MSVVAGRIAVDVAREGWQVTGQTLPDMERAIQPCSVTRKPPLAESATRRPNTDLREATLAYGITAEHLAGLRRWNVGLWQCCT